MGLKRGSIALVVALLVAVLVAGCGGSGSGSSDATGASTKAEFIAQGDKICAAAEAKKNKAITSAFSKTPKQSQEPTKAYEEELVTEVALPPIASMSEELSELPLPSGEEEEAEAILAAFQSAVAEIESNPEVAIEGAAQPFAEADKLAGEYGFKSCSEI